MSSAEAFAVGLHEISFSGELSDGGELTNAGHVERFLFALRNSTNGINAIGQSYPNTSADPEFNATFRYRESTDGSLSLESIEVALSSALYAYDLSTGPEGQLFTERARDIWRVNMDHQGQVLSRSSDTGQYIVSIATDVGAAVGNIESLNTAYLGIPLPGQGTVGLYADGIAKMTVRSRESFFELADLATALMMLDNMQLSFVWDGIYSNPACGPTCGSGSFITWASGSSTGVTSVYSTSTDVPEPTSLALFGAGLVGVYRRRKAAQAERAMR